MKPKEIIERIMTQHWDMAACQCWVCVEGRAFGYRPKDIYLIHKDKNPQPTVAVEDKWWKVRLEKREEPQRTMIATNESGGGGGYSPGPIDKE